ncbi:MAG: type II toxin-antitoxin system YoeB family toxin [Bacteroidales bacterium]|nr:type II toxin-antitoxin system YoeB family toxin [Bacteroidales bacterium]MBN2821379.1 type II toxin-antitoxin system YoeB family toxin [Bacteroidales bacterium]
MELVCNELSFYPLASNGHIAEERFRTILQTFRGAKEKYDFTHIRFPKNYSSQQITSTQTLYEWISTLTNPTLKTLILTLFRPPYTDDLEEVEMDRFFESNYIITNYEAPVKDSPVGLPVAHIKAVPCISFSSHDFWKNRKIHVSKTNGSTNEDAIFDVYNICLSTDLETQEINEWAENSFPEFINSSELLEKYLGYTKYSTVFSSDFLKQLFEWKNNDIDIFKYILLLMKDVELHPFTGGRGQTENLKNRGKEASKRINNSYPDGDRLSYTIENNIVTYLACKGHYSFH